MRMLLAGLLFAHLAVGAARADDKPVPRSVIDRWAAQAAYDAAAYGTELYNKGNHESCFRIYQATLVAVRPLLDHRPKLAELVLEKIEKAKTAASPIEGSVILREALDAVQAETTGGVAPSPKGAAAAPKKPLWERLGGEANVKKIVHEFTAAALKDPKINFLRDGKYKLDEKGVAKLEESLTALVSTISGGNLKYTGRDMPATHKGMKITDAEYQAMGFLLAQVLAKNNVAAPEIRELLEALGAVKKDIVGQ